MALPPLVEPGPPLGAEESLRFSRHLLLPEIGELGQRRLNAARVCVMGAGGLGAPALLYLAAAGVGTLGIVDDDVVELSNLQRQVIHGTADLGRAKVDSATDAVRGISPAVTVETHSERLTGANAARILGEYDLVLDGTDNFGTRYLVADTCARLGLPLVWASILRFDAQVSVFWSAPPTGSGVPGVGLRDLFPQPPADGTVESCSTAGVLGALCGQVGSIMATEAIKLITGTGQPLLGRVLVLDALSARWSEIPLHPAPAAAHNVRGVPAVPAHSRQPVQVMAPGLEPVRHLSADELARRLVARAQGRDDFVLLDVRDAHEHKAGAIPDSVLLPLPEVFTEQGRTRLAPRSPVIVYCQHEGRARRAASELVAAGFDRVEVLAGGFAAWPQPSSPTP